MVKTKSAFAQSANDEELDSDYDDEEDKNEQEQIAEEYGIAKAKKDLEDTSAINIKLNGIQVKKVANNDSFYSAKLDPSKGSSKEGYSKRGKN